MIINLQNLFTSAKGDLTRLLLLLPQTAYCWIFPSPFKGGFLVWIRAGAHKVLFWTWKSKMWLHCTYGGSAVVLCTFGFLTRINVPCNPPQTSSILLEVFVHFFQKIPLSWNGSFDLTWHFCFSRYFLTKAFRLNGVTSWSLFRT